MRATARWINGILTFAMIVMLLVGGSLVWFRIELDRKGPLQQAKIVKIKSGSGVRAIAETLEEQGVIASRHVFLAYHLGRWAWARWHGGNAAQLKAGDYEIGAGDSIRDVMGRIVRGKSVLYSVTIPEGLTSQAIVARLSSDPGLKGTISGVPHEGFLKPETYLVPPGSERQMVIDLMLNAQREFLKKAWAARQENLPFKDVSEALILASIVQRETGPRDDPARVASVFVNRLRRGMRLQSDPTILYGKYGSSVDWGTKIYRSDIAKATAHNTYQINGLPPTPICNPGAVAINSVLNPARTEDLYFVADGKGGHIFSKTNAEHVKAVAHWRKIEKDIRREQRENAASGASGTPTPPATAAVAGGGGGDVMSTFGFPLPVRKPTQH